MNPEKTAASAAWTTMFGLGSAQGMLPRGFLKVFCCLAVVALQTFDISLSYFVETARFPYDVMARSCRTSVSSLPDLNRLETA